MGPPAKGRPCRVRIDGEWLECTVKRCNEDGTFNVIPVGETSFLSVWECILAEDVCFDGAAVAEQRPAGKFYKLYWNNIRMGGRDPASLKKKIGLSDALGILGIAEAEEDATTAKALDAFERQHKVTLPRALRELWSKKNARNAIAVSHCNCPEPCDVKDWEILRGSEKDAWGKRIAVRIMLPHQGNHEWWAVFEDGDDDGEIWASFDATGPMKLLAPSVPFFFWDLAETDRVWHLSEAEEDEDDQS